MPRESTPPNVDHIDVRLIRVPKPESLQVVVLDRLGPELAQHLASAVRAALRADCDMRPEGWSALWMTHTHSFFEIGEYVEQVRLGCDGDDGGAHLAACIAQLAIEVRMPSVQESGTAPPDAEWSPIAARWGRWVAGATLGDVCAVLEALGGLLAPDVVPAPPLAALRCPACGDEIVPTRLLGPGMPAPDGSWELAVDRGEAELLGCCVHECHGTARCPKCGADFVPAVEDVKRIADAALGSGGARPVPRSRTIYEAGGARAWLPSAKLGATHWWFAIGRSQADALDEVQDAIVLLRLVGTACLCVPWARLREAVVGSERDRTHMHVLASDPVAVRIAGLRIEGTWDPSALQDGPPSGDSHDDPAGPK